MKTKLILCFILVGFINNLIAQNFDSYFGTEETHIVQINNNYTLGGFPYSIDSLAITSEVIALDNTVYKKVDQFSYYEPNIPSHTFYLREDTSDGKLWLRTSLQGSEVLIADMSLEVADTVTFFSNYNPHTVTDVTYINGKKHIFFDDQYLFTGFPGMSYSPENVFLKEGVFPPLIGEPIGQEISNLYFYGETATICVTKDSNQIFSIDDYWDINPNPYESDWVICELFDIYNLSNQQFQKNQVSIYPNPAKNELYINRNQVKIESIEIFDLNGKQLFKSQPSNGQPLDISQLLQGTYLLKVKGKNEMIAKRFVKR